MVTDPPYGIEYDPKWRREAGLSKSKRIRKIENDDRASWAMAYSLFPGDVCYIWHASRYGTAVDRSLRACGYDVRSQIIWVKRNFALSRGHYHWRHEACWYAIKKQASSAHWRGNRRNQTVWADIVDHWTPKDELFASIVDEKTLLAFDAAMTTVWEIGHDLGDKVTLHATQKPVECMARPMRNHEGDVYDPFLGSGSTLIAAEQLGRICYGMELDPVYCDVIVARWEKFTGKKAELVRE